MSVAGVPVGGLNIVGQIVPTNILTFHEGQNGLAIAVALLSTHTAGAPVVDRQGHYLGFINEFDHAGAGHRKRYRETHGW